VVFDGGDFAGAEFSGGTVNFGHAVFSGGEVDFSAAVFSGGTVSFRAAMFSGGKVSRVNIPVDPYHHLLRAVFSGSTVIFAAVFSGGTVNFGGAAFPAAWLASAAPRSPATQSSSTALPAGHLRPHSPGRTPLPQA
jgi:hypothetical protein